MKGTLKFLVGFLFFIIAFVMLGTILSFMGVGNRSLSEGLGIVQFFEKIGIMAIYLFMLARLLGIVNRISNKDIFCKKNVTAMKQIGLSIIAVGVFDMLITIHIPHKFALIQIDAMNDKASFSIGGEILFYLVLGLLAYVLSEVFQKAIDIKDENDLTI